MGLFKQFLKQANSQIFFGVRDTQMTRVLWMHKDMV